MKPFAVGALALALSALSSFPSSAEPPPAFTAIVLGASGGIDESDLTSILVGHPGGDFVALDAGTLYSAIERARTKGAFGDSKSTGAILKQRVKAYLISHPHLDHVAGLTIVSPDDSPKPIFGLPSTLDALRAHLFGGPLWANFTDEGEGALKRYHLARLEPGTPVNIDDTGLSVEALPLSHGAMTSTAFLVGHAGEYVLYLGDTGPDEIEKQGKLKALWTRVAPLVRSRKLRAIFLECSYPDPRPDNLLFGHLTPKWIARELDALAQVVDSKKPASALSALTLVITHIKPSLDSGAAPREQVAAQLQSIAPRLGKLIIPTSGQRIDL